MLLEKKYTNNELLWLFTTFLIPNTTSLNKICYLGEKYIYENLKWESIKFKYNIINTFNNIAVEHSFY